MWSLDPPSTCIQTKPKSHHACIECMCVQPACVCGPPLATLHNDVVCPMMTIYIQCMQIYFCVATTFLSPYHTFLDHHHPSTSNYSNQFSNQSSVIIIVTTCTSLPLSYRRWRSLLFLSSASHLSLEFEQAGGGPPWLPGWSGGRKKSGDVSGCCCNHNIPTSLRASTCTCIRRKIRLYINLYVYTRRINGVRWCTYG